MTDYFDIFFAHTLFDIIKYGVKIGYTGPDQFIRRLNLISANEASDIITEDLQKQIAHDCFFKLDSLPAKFISLPFGLVSKPCQKRWRHIHHLFYPKKRSVNDHILSKWGALEYSTIDNAICLIQHYGQGCRLTKQDFEDALHYIPIAKSD